MLKSNIFNVDDKQQTMEDGKPMLISYNHELGPGKGPTFSISK